MRITPGHPEGTLQKIEPPGPITHRTIDRVLIPGFGSVIGLLLAAGFIGINSARVVHESAAGLLQNQRLAVALTAELRNADEIVDAVLQDASGGASADRKRITAQLDAADLRIGRIIHQSRRTGDDEAAWRQLQEAAQGFSTSARAVLANHSPRDPPSPDLFRFHEKLNAAAAHIVSDGFERGLAAQNQIERRSSRWLNESVALLAGSLALALICTVVTLRITARLVRGMEEQGGELSRVSWHMLENQETTARRFSHELHDELGQTLTAIKANLSALRAGNPNDEKRLDDCAALVDEAVRNVRELSQLLHPTILDDFGLDASLRWLSERFTQRTGVEIEYESNFNERLAEDTEIHVFRIVQEALTNVARHSKATRVRIDLERRDARIHLSLVDNGKGFQKTAAERGMGLTGMRARARSAGGELTVTARNGSGVGIHLWAPLNNDKTNG